MIEESKRSAELMSKPGGLEKEIEQIEEEQY